VSQKDLSVPHTLAAWQAPSPLRGHGAAAPSGQGRFWDGTGPLAAAGQGHSTSLLSEVSESPRLATLEAFAGSRNLKQSPCS